MAKPKVGFKDTPQAQEFVQGGRADQAKKDSGKPEQTKNKGGRPPHEIKHQRTIVAIPVDDLARLDTLLLKWKQNAGHRTGVKITQVMRVLLSHHLETLEGLDHVLDEDDLARQLAAKK